MGREEVKEVVTTTTKVVHCDDCGREATDGIVHVPIERDDWDRRYSEDLTPRKRGILPPLYRCQDCRKQAPRIDDLPEREKRDRIQRAHGRAVMKELVAAVVFGFFLGVLYTGFTL